jgi:hypothetical protein
MGNRIISDGLDFVEARMAPKHRRLFDILNMFGTDGASPYPKGYGANALSKP